MRKMLIILILAMPIVGIAQVPSKKERICMSNAKLLEETVFHTKDSLTLEKMFSSGMTYGHSSGKIQDRLEAITGIIHNKSTYEELGFSTYQVKEFSDSISVLHVYKANETKENGTVSPLSIAITTIWIKEGKDWKLIRRSAVKVE